MFPIVMLTAKVEDMDKNHRPYPGRRRLHDQALQPAGIGGPRQNPASPLYHLQFCPCAPAEASYDFSGLYICRDSRKCSLYGRALSLTPLEFDILWYLCEHRGKVVSSEALFEAVWGEKYLDQNNTVMAHIARLREKMGEPSRKPKFIKTVWGVGYTLG